MQQTVEVSEFQEGLELDLVTHDIKKFLFLLLKKNGYVLEQLYSPLVVATTPEHEELKAIAAVAASPATIATIILALHRRSGSCF